MKSQPAPTVPGNTPGGSSDLHAKTIADLAARCAGPNQFATFDTAFRASLTVSKAAILQDEARAKRHAKQR